MLGKKKKRGREEGRKEFNFFLDFLNFYFRQKRWINDNEVVYKIQA